MNHVYSNTPHITRLSQQKEFVFFFTVQIFFLSSSSVPFVSELLPVIFIIIYHNVFIIFMTQFKPQKQNKIKM